MRCREEAVTLAKPLSSYLSCTKYKISTSVDAQRFEGENLFWNVRRMSIVWYSCSSWVVYDLWIFCAISKKHCSVNCHTTEIIVSFTTNSSLCSLQFLLLGFPPLLRWKLACAPCCNATWKLELVLGWSL